MSDEDGAETFEERTSDEEILAFVRSEEVVTTKEVAQHFEYHLQTARRRLKRLHEAGALEAKDVGKRYVWWISGD